MSKILVVAATGLEIQPLLKEMAFEKALAPKLNLYRFQEKEVAVLTTGVGMVATAFEMGKTLALHKFNIAINLGVAGSFNEKIAVGEVVNVVSDCFADLGAQDGEAFLSLPEMGLMDEDDFPFEKNWLKNNFQTESREIKNLSKVIGISVNKVHGDERSIENVVLRLNPDTESMEGAAFFYACFFEALPCLQIRAISNKVERRNKENWNMGLAIKNLNNKAIELLSILVKST